MSSSVLAFIESVPAVVKLRGGLFIMLHCRKVLPPMENHNDTGGDVRRSISLETLLYSNCGVKYMGVVVQPAGMMMLGEFVCL